MGDVQAPQPIRALIVEDNLDLAENIADFLGDQRYVLDFAMDGVGGLHLALTQGFDVIVLDIMLPAMDGYTFCKKLRQESGKQTPVLMLTARDTLNDKLQGFEAGGDDYLVKPFELAELEARMQALVRRSNQPASSPISIADLEIDKGRRQIRRAGQTIELNRSCFTILTLLVQASPNVVSRRDIEFALWGDMPPDSDALRSHMYALRRAIDKPFAKPLIRTVHGIGYKLVDPNDLSL